MKVISPNHNHVRHIHYGVDDGCLYDEIDAIVSVVPVTVSMIAVMTLLIVIVFIF